MRQEFLIRSLQRDLYREHYYNPENLKPNYSGGLQYSDSLQNLGEDRAFQTIDILKKVTDWYKN